jgi:hypothetical protein
VQRCLHGRSLLTLCGGPRRFAERRRPILFAVVTGFDRATAAEALAVCFRLPPAHASDRRFRPATHRRGIAVESSGLRVCISRRICCTRLPRLSTSLRVGMPSSRHICSVCCCCNLRTRICALTIAEHFAVFVGKRHCEYASSIASTHRSYSALRIRSAYRVRRAGQASPAGAQCRCVFTCCSNA